MASHRADSEASSNIGGGVLSILEGRTVSFLVKILPPMGKTVSSQPQAYTEESPSSQGAYVIGPTNFTRILFLLTDKEVGYNSSFSSREG